MGKIVDETGDGRLAASISYCSGGDGERTGLAAGMTDKLRALAGMWRTQAAGTV